MVTIEVRPGDVEVDRGSDVAIQVQITGTTEMPRLQFRERGGAWRTRTFSPDPTGETLHQGGHWETLLPRVDRNLEYQVEAPRATSSVFAILVRETPRLAGFRAHLAYPRYTGLPTETLTSGTGDLTALKGTAVDLRVLTNRPLSGGYLDWRDDREKETRRVDLTAVDATTWKTEFRMMKPASYAVVLLDHEGSERLRSPRYRVDPVADRPPHLTLHFPQTDHDLAEDMIERMVADAADDFGFSETTVRYRVDDGSEKFVSYEPFVAGQTEFRLDTLWDLSGLDLLPGSVVSYYVEVRDNDTVSGPKAVRSPIRRVRFPTLSELYEEVAREHTEEIDDLSKVQEAQEDLREKLKSLNEDLKRGREANWELHQDMEKSLKQQMALEEQISQITERLRDTLDKAANRAQMNQSLIQKMSEINKLLDNLADEDLKRNFRELSRALDRMDRDAIRRALENFQVSQEQMLRGMDRTIELLKQIRREEQIADVVQRTDEIAELQRQITEELEKFRENRRARETLEADTESGEDEESGTDAADSAEENESKDGERSESDGEHDRSESGEETNGEGESSETSSDEESTVSEELSEGESGDSEGDSEESDSKESDSKEGDPEDEGSESKSGDQKSESGDSKGGDGQKSDEEQQSESGAQMQQLAQEQKEAEERLEELKRLLKSLKKLNENQPGMASKLEEMAQSQAIKDLQKNMQKAQESMSGGQPQKAAPFAFKARDEANRLADMARNMQQQMAQAQEDDTIQRMETIIKGLIDVSGVEEQLATEKAPDSRLLAQRQFDLTERAEAWAESLRVVMQQSFSVSDDDEDGMSKAISRMTRATTMFEQGNEGKAMHEARESTSDLNETIVQLMQSHQQMCSTQGSGSGSSSQKMRGLTQGQQALNQSTRELLERLASQDRLTLSDEERMGQLAAQQEMIRQGLEALQQELRDQENLLGDLDQLAGDMKEVEERLEQHRVDPRIKERQEKILSRLLDAQRSVRQQEMSPKRQSETGTLAARPSPPPLPDEVLRNLRTLEEDVLRGANDRYPTQYRKLVEAYFRALSRENRAP